MGWEVKINMSGQSNDCLWVCNVKMKKFYWGRNGAHFWEFWGFGVIVSSDLNLFRWDHSCPSVKLLQTLLWTHFSQYQLDLDGAHGYIHGPCTTACILANTAWNLPIILHGILYHKLSTIMLIRRSAGCFKGHFQIFEHLPWFWTWWNMDIQRQFSLVSLLSVGVSLGFFYWR